MNDIIINQEFIEKAVKSYIQQSRQQDSREENAGYERRFQFLSLLLEHYREYPPGSRKNKFVAYLMERHRQAYREGVTEDFYKVRHNLLVYRFILSNSMGEKDICKKLGIKKPVYNTNIRKGISELMIYAFGIYGMR